MMFYHTLLVSLLIIFSISHELPYINSPIKNRAGIFYHNLGLAKISNDHYTILSYLNISFYNSKLILIKSIYNKTSNVCNTLNISSFHCQNSLELVKNQIPQLESKFDTISHLIGRRFSEKRKRRGIFNGGSYIFNWLFGIPDANDAKYYTDSINSLIQKNHDVQLLMKQQIQVISDAINKYNESAQALKSNELKLNENIEKFNKFAKSTTDTIKSFSINQFITDHVNLLRQVINELNEQCDLIVSSILFAKLNILHPSIITPKNLHDTLSQIKLSSDKQFPIPLKDYDNIHTYFSICQLSVIFNNELLIYAIEIPLVNEEIYNLYNLIPLPISLANSSFYSYINTPFPYLLLSTTKTYYSRLRDLSTCKEITEGDYVCKNQITRIVDEKPVCEIILRNNLSIEIPEDCSTTTIKANIDIWHRLSGNSWLYVMSKATAATVSCDDSNIEVFDVNLNGNGILKLKSKCKCYTSSTVLISTTNQSKNYTNYIPEINISEDNCCKLNQYLNNDGIQLKPMDIHNFDLNELRVAKHKLEEFDSILQQNINKPYIILSTSWIATFFIIGLFIIAILLACCFYKNCKILRFRNCEPQEERTFKNQDNKAEGEE